MAAMLLRLHPCPLLFPPPPPHPHLRRQLAVYSIPKSSFRSGAAAARARNPPRLAAVGGAERRRVGDDYDEEEEDLGQALERTRQLVECAMFASVAGLAYFLSNSLAIENYFSCFFPLPIVISSLRWGLEAGRKTAVATVLLLFTLSGPVKASTYLLMHGVVGLAMGTMWRLETNWIVSIILCSITRALGACGNFCSISDNSQYTCFPDIHSGGSWGEHDSFHGCNLCTLWNAASTQLWILYLPTTYNVYNIPD
ncbi:uncharacterized protein LOC127761169 isoform X3 [Oryza glaberrima]|uniref:uncharacterized protein LOC127761169 isoform X3 n=1 Tax=Oryza glaberrima TaxID=4538 RepID=UPI00224BF096|nr:uncharacterized protein LOC127761169 isoform X3 [Oryza glaberrima]